MIARTPLFASLIASFLASGAARAQVVLDFATSNGA